MLLYFRQPEKLALTTNTHSRLCQVVDEKNTERVRRIYTMSNRGSRGKSRKGPFLGATRGFMLLARSDGAWHVGLARTEAGHLGFLKGKPELEDDGNDKQTAAREMWEESTIPMEKVRVVPGHEFHELNDKGNLSVACWIAIYHLSGLPPLHPRLGDELAAVGWKPVERALVDPRLRPARQRLLADAMELIGNLDLSNTDEVARLPLGTDWLVSGPDTGTVTHQQGQPIDDGEVKEKASHSRLSHALSQVLRHQAVQLGLRVRSDGCVSVDALLALPMFCGVTREQLEHTVATNEKQRFAFDRSGDYIRANQGHSHEVAAFIRDEEIADLLVEPLPVCVHGTSRAAAKAIRREGLKCMGRDWIHLAAGLPGEVVSGIRRHTEVLVYVDMKRAMADGIEFRRSANGVIETRGRDGTLAPTYLRFENCQ